MENLNPVCFMVHSPKPKSKPQRKKERKNPSFYIEKCEIRMCVCGPFDIWLKCYNTKYTIKPTQTLTPFQAPYLNILCMNEC